MARQMELVRFLFIYFYFTFFLLSSLSQFNSIRIFYLFTFDLRQSFVCSLFLLFVVLLLVVGPG